MGSLGFYLVAFIYASLVTTKMAAGQSGSGDVGVTSPSSSTVCFTEISRTSVCSIRQNDIVKTSQEEYDVTKYDVTTTQHPADDDVTSGALCKVSAPRKSEMDYNLRWLFSRGRSYLNLTLAEEDSVIAGGYFVVLDSRCDDTLRWNMTIVSRSRRKTFNITSRRSNSSINGAAKFSFNLEKSLQAKEIYVVFAGGQRDATRQQEQQGYYCGYVVDLELLRPCNGPPIADIISNDTAEDDKGSSQTPSPRTPSQSIYPSTVPQSKQSRRTTPFLNYRETTTSTQQQPQSYKGSFRIRNQEFLQSLNQDTTDEFKSLHSKIYPLLITSYSLTCGPSFRGIQKIAFRSGSVVVDNWFEVTGYLDVGQFQNRSSVFIIGQFNLSGFDVDPRSFEFEYYNGDKAKSGSSDDTKLMLIIVVSTVLGVLIIVLVVIAALLIWRKTRRRDPEDEDETERQMAAQEVRTRDVISGMPRPQLVWQNMPSLKAGFDDQSLYVYEIPPPSPTKARLPPTRKLPSAHSLSISNTSTSSSSSSPWNFLHYSHSDSKHDPRFHIPRPRTAAESTHASFSGISPRGWGNSQHGVAGETSQVWGQLPLDYNSVTHDYFVSGPSKFSHEPAGKKKAVRSQSTRPGGRTTKFSPRKSGSAPDAVDFGDVFLPSVPPFQLSDVLRCHEVRSEEVERSGKTTARSTSICCGAGGSRGIESDECAIHCGNNNTVCGKNGQQHGLEDRCITSSCCGQPAERITSPTQSPHTSGSITNSQVNLLSANYSKSLKKKQSTQTPDNIHRSTVFTIADNAFFQNIGVTSNL